MLMQVKSKELLVAGKLLLRHWRHPHLPGARILL
jgi:hypothetical protein